jgi:hypothetical protein
MPPSGDDIKQESYGPDEERGNVPLGMPHLFMGIDLTEWMRPMVEHPLHELADRINEPQFVKAREEAGKRAVEPRGRRTPDP